MRLILTAVGVKRVTSPMPLLILGLASMVAELFFSSSPWTRSGGFMMLGGALSTLGLVVGMGIMLGITPGGGMLGGAPGGRIRRGGGIPVTG